MRPKDLLSGARSVPGKIRGGEKIEIQNAEPRIHLPTGIYCHSYTLSGSMPGHVISAPQRAYLSICPKLAMPT